VWSDFFFFFSVLLNGPGDEGLQIATFVVVAMLLNVKTLELKLVVYSFEKNLLIVI
jgi:hypothetical protein